LNPRAAPFHAFPARSWASLRSAGRSGSSPASTIIGTMIPASLVLMFAAGAAADLSGVEPALAAQRYREALSSLEGVPAGSRNAAWYLLASKAYDGLNDPRNAVESSQAAIDLDPAGEPPYLQLAQIFLTRNTPEAAAEILRDASRLFPQSPLIRLGLGLALKDLRQYDDAAATLRETLGMKPDLGTAFDALGAVYLNAGRYNDLCDDAARYMEKNPGDYRGYYYLAAGKQKNGSPAGDLEPLLKKCLELNSAFAAGYALLGKVRLDAGQVSSAIGALEQATRLRPDYTPAHMYLATAYNQAGRKAEARREATLLARLNEEQSRPVPHLRYHRAQSGAGKSGDGQVAPR
jgi:tetratricopeptide (TPR) repeat protein